MSLQRHRAHVRRSAIEATERCSGAVSSLSQLEVGGTVVGFVSVDVVNSLVTSQRPIENLRHHESVFLNVSIVRHCREGAVARHQSQNVSLAVDHFTAAPFPVIFSERAAPTHRHSLRFEESRDGHRCDAKGSRDSMVWFSFLPESQRDSLVLGCNRIRRADRGAAWNRASQQHVANHSKAASELSTDCVQGHSRQVVGHHSILSGLGESLSICHALHSNVQGGIWQP